jgi:hypothetical protein
LSCVTYLLLWRMRLMRRICCFAEVCDVCFVVTHLAQNLVHASLIDAAALAAPCPCIALVLVLFLSPDSLFTALSLSLALFPRPPFPTLSCLSLSASVCLCLCLCLCLCSSPSFAPRAYIVNLRLYHTLNPPPPQMRYTT